MKNIGCLVALFVLAGTSANCQIIGYKDAESIDKVPQSVMNTIGRQKWLFTHASVGQNMLSGMNALHNANPARYQLTVSSVGYNDSSMRAANPPNPTSTGRIYDCNRGNPGWSAKFTIFDNSVRLAGWKYPNVDFCMDKLCYIDQDANASQYTIGTSALETFSPNTIMVYTTIPLTNSSDNSNVLRNQYNDAVRAYCTVNKKLLFDIADIESHDPDGNVQTFQYNGNTYQKLYDGYTTDGGHLNSAGESAVAKGWYAAAASTVPYATNNKGAADLATGIVAFHKWFAVWGKVETIDTNSFWVNDGSNKRVRIIAPAYSGFENGDTVKAWGMLDNSPDTAVMTTTSGRILKLN